MSSTESSTSFRYNPPKRTLIIFQADDAAEANKNTNEIANSSTAPSAQCAPQSTSHNLLTTSTVQYLSSLGSHGGLVLPLTNNKSSACTEINCLLEILGLNSPHNVLPPAVCAAAEYPSKYGKLKISILTTDNNMHFALQQHLNSSNTKPADSSHITSSTLLTKLDDVPHLTRTVLAALNHQCNADTNARQVILVHLSSHCKDAAAVRDALISSILPQNSIDNNNSNSNGESKSSNEYSDVYCSLILHHLIPHRPAVSSLLSSILPSQSYQLSYPQLTPQECSYLLYISYHKDTTRCDSSKNTKDSTNVPCSNKSLWYLGSGSLVSAVDWLGEIAYKLGGKAKYGA